MLALGAARSLQPTDLWKMDDARSADPISTRLARNYYVRQTRANEYNALLADPSTPLPTSRRILYSVLPHREKRENDYRMKHGKRKASLAWALSDTFGLYFWLAGLYKIFGDTCSAVTPLLMKALIKWVTLRNLAKAAGEPGLPIGHGIGMAIGLLLLLVSSSIGIHHFFVSE